MQRWSSGKAIDLNRIHQNLPSLLRFDFFFEIEEPVFLKEMPAGTYKWNEIPNRKNNQKGRDLQGNHTKVDTQISMTVTYVIKGTNLTALGKY